MLLVAEPPSEPQTPQKARSAEYDSPRKEARVLVACSPDSRRPHKRVAVDDAASLKLRSSVLWWFSWVLSGPLGVLLAAAHPADRPLHVVSGCTGQASELWAMRVPWVVVC